MRAFYTYFPPVHLSIRRTQIASACTPRLALWTGIALAVVVVLVALAPTAQAVPPTPLPKKTYTTNATWTAAESPYIVEGDQTVAQGVTLTIEPGVVVKSRGLRSINVYGTLRALGAPGKRITFTSIQDDTVAGDTGADGATLGQPGQWARIFVSGTASTAELNHVTVRYGGYACCSYPYTYGVLFAHDGAKVTASQALLEHNQHYAVRAVTSCTTSPSCAPEVSLESSVLYDNKGGVSTTNGVGHLRKSVVLANDLRGAYYALTTAYRGPASEVMDSDVQDNGEEGVFLAVDETSLAQVPTEHWPHGNRNNIWGNNSATATSPVQLWGQKPRRAVNWKNNFWGWNTAFGENTEDCVDAGYPGRLRYPGAGEDPDDPAPDGLGPIRHKYDLVTANGVTASCYFDYYDTGGPNEFAKTPYNVFREGGPSPEINPYNDLLDLLRTFGSCAFLQHAVTPIVCQGDPVQSATGNFTHSAVDLTLPGIGVPFEFERAYNSLDERDGPLGRGWTHSYDIGLGIASDGDVEFRGEYGQRLQFSKQADGSYGDRAGVRSRLEKTADGYKLTRPDQVVYGFDNAGNLTSLRDRNGQGLAFTHTSGELTGITDSAGRAITMSYNVSGKLSEVALPDARKVTYGYTSGLLTSVTNARGKTTTYTYDGGQRLATEVDANNHTVFANTYGADGRVTEQIDALGKKTMFAWDAATETATATDARGNQWKDVYSNRVLVARVDPLGNTTTYGYDADFNLVSETDPRGNTTTTTYDAQGNMLKRTAPAPLSYEETFSYNARNDVTSATDRRGNTTTFGYDTAGNLTSTTEPGNGGAGFTTTFGRDPAGTGLLKSVTDPRGKVTSFGHDAAGNLTSVTSQAGSVETMGYDQSGRMTSRVSPRGNVQGATPDDFKTTYTYNGTDQLTGVTNPLGHVWTFGYDDVGNRTSQTDPRNRTTTWAYDAVNRLASVTAPDSAETSYAYDAIGNVTSRTDAKDHTTTWTYDAANRLASEVSPANDSYTYSYDKAGNLTQVVDANGNATTDTTDGKTGFSYDALNRLTAVDYGDATPDASFGYDGNGNRTQMTDVAGTETYSYDVRNQLTGVTRGADVFSYTYDPAGNLESRTYPGGRVTSYSYDDDGQLATAASDGATTAYSYDKDGNLTRTELPAGNGHVETRAYDRAGRLTELVSAKSGTTLFSSTYTYDDVGNPTALQTSDGPVNYSYDAQDRVTEACYAATCAGGSDPFIRYGYDDVGNRTTETRPSGTTSYTYDAADRLTSKTTGGTTTNYTFDRNGNQTQAGARTFSYDLADRLKSTTEGTTTETYTYDGDGKRVTASTGAGAADTAKYLWDVTHPNAQVAIERDGDNDPRRAHTYGRGRIAMHTGGSAFYYHHDQVGSVTNLTSASGAKQRSYSYEPFGTARTSVTDDPNAPANPMRFAGEQLDTTTSLYHLRARQYDPDTGRFLATDPLPHPSADPYVNTYHYAKNRPGVLIDPSGMGSVWPDDDDGNSFCSSIQFLCDAGDAAGDVAHDSWEFVSDPRTIGTTLHVIYIAGSGAAAAATCVMTTPAGCALVLVADAYVTNAAHKIGAFDDSALDHEPFLPDWVP